MPIVGRARRRWWRWRQAARGAATTSVTITVPAAGQSISLKKTPYLAVAGKASFAPTTAGATTLDTCGGDGCGTSNDNPHLSVTTGTDAGDGCGLLFNAWSSVRAVTSIRARSSTSLRAMGMPLPPRCARCDHRRDLAAPAPRSALLRSNVTLEALINGEAVTLGKTTGSAVLDPTGDHTPVPFSIQPSSTLDGFRSPGTRPAGVLVHGHRNIYSGFISLSGNSYANVPSYAPPASTRPCRLSLDDSTFAKAVPARIDATGTAWSVAIPTPAIGKHRLYARSTQGFDTSAPTSVAFSDHQVRREVNEQANRSLCRRTGDAGRDGADPHDRGGG